MLKSLLLAALLALPTYAIETEGLVPIGAYQSRQDNLITCQDGTHVKIQFLTPDLVRVRMAYQSQLDDGHSWAIAKTDWSPAAVSSEESSENVTYRSSNLRVVVHKNPLLIEIQDKNGLTLNKDSRPLLGDPNHTQKVFDASAGFMTVVTKELGLDEHFYALGEKAHKLDRRRGHFRMFNSDTPKYGEGTDPIYQSIPFYISLEDNRAYGLFYDNSYRSHFDFGNSQQEFTGYAVEGGQIDYYFVNGPRIKDVVQRYTELTGRIYLPPKWALGHQASRWSYYPDRMVEKIADTYQQHDLPLDVMTIDIDYMQKYRVFTWDLKRFSDPDGLAGRLKAKGLHMVNIVDPGVKYQPEGLASAQEQQQPELKDQSKSYYVYNQGSKNDFFVKRKDGTQMVTTVWPGQTVFVDFTKEAARKWWGDLHQAYLDHGTGGIWNDMNEPADFTEKGDTGANQRDSYFDDLGHNTPHAKNRNVFALLMCKATYEGLLRLRPNDRPYVITRAAYAGIQRYSTMWTGDAASSWEALAVSVPLFCNLGLSGETFIGADVGGFMGRGDGEMLTRGYQICFLVPFCRNHKAQDEYDQEPWRFGSYYEGIIRKYLKLRYRLLPYLYAGLDEARRMGTPFVRPLVLEYQDDSETYAMDDQFLAGRDLLCSPVVRPNQDKKRVYLPRGKWYDFYTGAPQKKQHQLVDAPLETVPLYARGGSIIPLGPEKNTVDALPNAPLELRIYPDARGQAESTLYEDDGKSQAYLNGQCARRKASFRDRQFNLEATGYALPQRSLQLRFYATQAKGASYNGKPVPLTQHPNYIEVQIPEGGQAHSLKLI